MPDEFKVIERGSAPSKTKIPTEKESIENDAPLFAAEYKTFCAVLRKAGVEVGPMVGAVLFTEFNRWRKDKS